MIGTALCLAMLTSHSVSQTQGVSEAAAYASFTKFETSFAASIRLEGIGRPVFDSNSNSPVTPVEVISEFSRFSRIITPYFKVTPIPQFVDLKAIVLKGQPRAAALKLIRWGFIGPTEATVCIPDYRYSEDDLGIILGDFISRLSELVQMPDPKWTPDLMINDELPAAPIGKKGPIKSPMTQP